MTRRWVGSAALIGLVAAASAWLVTGGDDNDNAGAEAADLATTALERRDLIESETFNGSLGFADERLLTSARTGTLTWIAREGSTIRRGGILYEADERPVVLMFGAVPAYRMLSAGAVGRDVRQLQRNLLALGFDADGDLEVNGDFDADTVEAVRDWQHELGVNPTGIVELGDVMFGNGARRMGEHSLEEGSGLGPGAQVATTTSLERIVSVDLDASDQDLASKGDRVEVELPGGERVAGRIRIVSKVAVFDPQDREAEPTVEVTVGLLGRVRTDLDETPVDVDIETSRAEGVLAAPVQALLALAEGGYALEVVDGPGRTHLVGVDTGTFADGFVEVSGADLSEGLEVVTAS